MKSTTFTPFDKLRTGFDMRLTALLRANGGINQRFLSQSFADFRQGLK